MADSVQLDLGVANVHQPGGAPTAVFSISAAKRKSLPESSFALPSQRKYPLDTAKRTRNAAARLEQMKKRGAVTDAEYKEARARIAKAAKSFGIESQYNESDHAAPPAAGAGKGTVHVRADLAPGGALHVRHAMSTSADGRQSAELQRDGALCLRDVRAIRQGEEVDPASAGVNLIGPDKWSDGTPKKLVWVQLAEIGEWKGHQSGAFKLTSQTFDEIIANFSSRGLPVPWDYEHFSEVAEPPPGAVETGTPAPAWTHKLENRGIGGLWGLTEFLDKLRLQIKAGEYAFLSPAIRLNAKNPRTGERAGARLTSVAATNQPFLTQLGQLHAARDAAELEDAVVDLRLGPQSLHDSKLHSSHEMMANLRSALKMDPLTTPQDVSDRLEKLRDMCMTAGPDGMCAGTQLHDFLEPLKALASMPIGSSYEDLLDAFDEFVDAEIEKHVFQGQPTPESPPPSASMADHATEDTAMADHTEALTTALKDVATREATITANCAEIRTLSDKIAGLQGLVDAKTAEIADLTDKSKARDTLLSAKDEEIAALKVKSDEQSVALKAHSDAEEQRVVGERFETYKDRTKMSKDAFQALFRTDRKLFDKEFPHVEADKRHLMREITPPEGRGDPTNVMGDVSPDANIQKLMKDKGMSYEQAMQETFKRKPPPRK